jgi:hypothetical protein
MLRSYVCVTLSATLILSNQFSVFISIQKYGISFWSNLFKRKAIFTLQKKTVTTITGAKHIYSCRGLFKRLEILSLPFEYKFSLSNFKINNEQNCLDQFSHTALTQGLSTIFIGQLPPSNVLKKYILCLHQNFQPSTT